MMVTFWFYDLYCNMWGSILSFNITFTQIYWFLSNFNDFSLNWFEIQLVIRRRVGRLWQATRTRITGFPCFPFSPFSSWCIIFLPFLDTRFCAVADEGNDYIYVMGGYYNKYKAYQYKVREKINWKKTFSIGHCPNYLPPPPMTPIRATWSSFFGSRNSRFESQFRT